MIWLTTASKQQVGTPHGVYEPGSSRHTTDD